MTTKWINNQDGMKLGDAGFLVRITHETDGWINHRLRDTPAHTNQSREPRLTGWCGSYNNVSTTGVGAWKITRVAANGRMLVTRLEGEELQAFLEEMGYPDLEEDE